MAKPAPARKIDTAQTAALFADKCGSCHGEKGEGMDGAAPRLSKLTKSIDEFIKTTRKGTDNGMPGFNAREVSPRQMRDLYAWLKTDPAGPPAAPDSGVPAPAESSPAEAPPAAPPYTPGVPAQSSCGKSDPNKSPIKCSGNIAIVSSVNASFNDGGGNMRAEGLVPWSNQILASGQIETAAVVIGAEAQGSITTNAADFTGSQTRTFNGLSALLAQARAFIGWGGEKKNRYRIDAGLLPATPENRQRLLGLNASVALDPGNTTTLRIYGGAPIDMRFAETLPDQGLSANFIAGATIMTARADGYGWNAWADVHDNVAGTEKHKLVAACGASAVVVPGWLSIGARGDVEAPLGAGDDNPAALEQYRYSVAPQAMLQRGPVAANISYTHRDRPAFGHKSDARQETDIVHAAAQWRALPKLNLQLAADIGKADGQAIGGVKAGVATDWGKVSIGYKQNRDNHNVLFANIAGNIQAGDYVRILPSGSFLYTPTGIVSPGDPRWQAEAGLQFAIGNGCPVFTGGLTYLYSSFDNPAAQNAIGAHSLSLNAAFATDCTGHKGYGVQASASSSSGEAEGSRSGMRSYGAVRPFGPWLKEIACFVIVDEGAETRACFPHSDHQGLQVGEKDLDCLSCHKPNALGADSVEKRAAVLKENCDSCHDKKIKFESPGGAAETTDDFRFRAQLLAKIPEATKEHHTTGCLICHPKAWELGGPTGGVGTIIGNPHPLDPPNENHGTWRNLPTFAAIAAAEKIPPGDVCNECHRPGVQYRSPQHGKPVTMDVLACGPACHGKTATNDALKKAHPAPDWRSIGHKVEASFDDGDCYRCHTEDRCTGCHLTSIGFARARAIMAGIRWIDVEQNGVKTRRHESTQTCKTCHTSKESKCASCH